ncbi:MAG: hypothetical protein ACJAXZ_004578 [Akkermansiaceae bacterium]|jgi:hypothetical protein
MSKVEQKEPQMDTDVIFWKSYSMERRWSGCR